MWSLNDDLHYLAKRHASQFSWYMYVCSVSLCTQTNFSKMLILFVNSVHISQFQIHLVYITDNSVVNGSECRSVVFCVFRVHSKLVPRFACGRKIPEQKWFTHRNSILISISNIFMEIEMFQTYDFWSHWMWTVSQLTNIFHRVSDTIRKLITMLMADNFELLFTFFDRLDWLFYWLSSLIFS